MSDPDAAVTGEPARLFIAVVLSPELIEQVAALPRAEASGLRWARPDQWHLTLRFLGLAPVAAAVTALAEVRAPTVVATFGPAVAVLGTGILSIPVLGLGDLAEAVREATRSVGQPPGRRRFRGHLTLAHFRGAKPSLVGTPFAAELPVDRIALMRSELRPEGARYEVVVERELR